VILRVAFLGRAQHRALVAADVDEGGEAPLRVARREHRRPPDMRRGEIVGFPDLRFEPEKAPGALKNEFLLELEQLRVRVHVAMHAEDAFRGTIIHVQADVLQVHG